MYSKHKIILVPIYLQTYFVFFLEKNILSKISIRVNFRIHSNFIKKLTVYSIKEHGIKHPLAFTRSFMVISWSFV